jgi:probable rRNA maturation factor
MIYIDNRQNKVKIDEKLEEVLEQVIAKTIEEEKVDKKVQISIIFVDNDEIKELNNEFRGIDKVTDVLSFPMLEYPDHKVFKDVYLNYAFEESCFEGEELILGDMALSLEKALEQSKEYNHSFNREVAYLTVHSILHLLGYDHIEEEDKIRMRHREEEILNKFNIKRQ